MKNWGLVLAVIGLALVLAAAMFNAREAFAQRGECPPLAKATATPPPQVYLTSSEIKLGGPLCLALDRARFFARERTALAAAEREVAAAEAALAVAGSAQETSPAATAAQTRLTQARAALDALPRERKVFIYLDEVRVPMEGRTITVRPAAGDAEWALEEIPLRGTEDASTEDAGAWRAILGGPRSRGIRQTRIGVAVAEADDRPPVMRALVRQPASLRLYWPLLLMTGGLGLTLLAAGIGMRGWNTGLLRDGNETSQFSLGRVQMALWLVLVVGGFLFIGLVSGQWRGVVTGGVIALLGISATTGVAAQLVDKDPQEPPRDSKGFWADIVEDGNGAALHRLQLIAWTILLAGIFVWTVSWSFTFPDFDTNLLLLAGIAGGTYLGFKFQEPAAAVARVEPATQEPADPVAPVPAAPAAPDPAR